MTSYIPCPQCKGWSSQRTGFGYRVSRTTTSSCATCHGKGQIRAPRTPTVSQVKQNLVEELERLAKLYEIGVLTEEEFVVAKKKLLS